MADAQVAFPTLVDVHPTHVTRSPIQQLSTQSELRASCQTMLPFSPDGRPEVEYEDTAGR